MAKNMCVVIMVSSLFGSGKHPYHQGVRFWFMCILFKYNHRNTNVDLWNLDELMIDSKLFPNIL